MSSCCCCGGIGIASVNKNEDNESSSVSEVSTESSIAETTEVTTEQETTTTKIEISSENFVNTVKEAIQGAVGEDEHIKDVVLKDSILTISVDLSKADTTIVSLEDLAVARASSITDAFLELEQYDELWNEIIIDFVDLGQVKKLKSDVIESSYGRYFDITENDILSY